VDGKWSRLVFTDTVVVAVNPASGSRQKSLRQGIAGSAPLQAQ